MIAPDSLHMVAAALLGGTLAGISQAGPLEAIRKAAGESEILPRGPNDQIEGTVWEYKGTLEKGEVEGEKDAKIEGMFRTEGEAIFAVNRRLKLPSRDDVEKIVDSVRTGEPKAFKLPSGRPKRIGEYKISRNGRLSLSFDDEENLFGTMILRRKKEQRTVWIGDFREKEDKKTVRTWQMVVRTIED